MNGYLRYPNWYNPKPYGMDGIGKNDVIVWRKLTSTIIIHEQINIPTPWRVVKITKRGNCEKIEKTIFSFSDERKAMVKAMELNWNVKNNHTTYTVSKIE